MSKERELLERWLDDTIFEPEELDSLMEETRELLAQPEQEEREVSGKLLSTDDVCNWNLTVGGLKDYDHVYVNGVRYVEFQPEQRLTPLTSSIRPSRCNASNEIKELRR
jgi:hypothetical protein